MKTTYDELARIVKDQHQTIDRLEKRIIELEERLGINSSNISKPPPIQKKQASS